MLGEEHRWFLPLVIDQLFGVRVFYEVEGSGLIKLKKVLDKFVAGVQLNRRVHVHLYFAFFVNDPLAKVPRQLEHSTRIFSRHQFFCV